MFINRKSHDHPIGLGRRVALIAFLVISAALLSSTFAQDRPAAYGKDGMVVAAHPISAQIGQQILAKGGNAMDAAIASAASVGLMEPNLSSPFGVGYLLFYSPEIGEVQGLEFGGRGPAALTVEGFENDVERRRTAKSIAVPGNIAGWSTALEAYGTMTLAEVFAPIIRVAEEGFPLSATLANGFNSLVRNYDYAETHAAYAKPGGGEWQVGDIYRNQGYADTLRAVAEEGPEVVYGGRIGQEIVDTIQKYGGFMELEDLANYEAEWMTPISTTYRGYTVYTNDAPSTGVQTLQTLNILEGYDLVDMGHGSADYLHVFMEAVNLAATDRNEYLGDPDFVDIPMEMLLSKEMAAERRELIDMAQTTTQYPASWQEGTTHLSAADQWGNVVAITQTLASGWGSAIVAGDTGIILNNSYAYANLDPNHPGVVGALRRQAWCLSPMMIFDANGDFWASVGTPGGETIQQTQAQVISNLIDFNMDPQEAVQAPRFAHTWMGQPTFEYPEFGVLLTRINAGFDEAVYAELEARGHSLQVIDRFGYIGSVAVIRSINEWYVGGADSRRVLYAVGY